jgi:hypothetical protein
MGTDTPNLPPLVRHGLEVIRDRTNDLDNIRGGFVVVLAVLRDKRAEGLELISSALDALEQAMEAPLNDILAELGDIAPKGPRT